MGVGELVGVCMCVHEGKINWERERIGHVFFVFQLELSVFSDDLHLSCKKQDCDFGAKNSKR